MKKSITLALTLPALALLASCGGNKADVDTNTTLTDNGSMTEITSETDNGVMNATIPTPAMSGQEFANTAASTDAYEIAAGKLAQSKATTQALKDFGKMMVDNHTESTANLKKAAAKASPAITPDPTLTAEQAANLDTLRSATGADFDNAYKSQQVMTHQKALAGMQGYAAGGDVPELKDFASSTATVVQTHLEKIQGM
jgi:putative membrane protein